MVRVAQKQNIVLNRVKRVPVVVFLRKILPFILFLLFVLISFLIGVWDIKRFEYTNSELVNVTPKGLDSYLSQYIGKNIFSIKPLDVKNLLMEKDGYIRDVVVKKILPNTLEISIEEFPPMYVGYSSERCLLFADTGELILEVCSECIQECTNYTNENTLVFISSSSLLESGRKLIYFEEIYMVEVVLSEFNYQITTLDISNGVATFKDIENHTFTFDLSADLDIQLARMYLVGEKIDRDMIKYTSLDLRFERPVMKL